MRRHLLLAAIGLALFSFGSLQAEDTKKDHDSIQGTWEITEFVMNGKPAPEEVRTQLKVVFSGDTMQIMGPGGIGKREYKFKLDPASKPKAIDTIPQDGPFKGKTGPAIYELEGENLTLCMPNRETSERPKELKAPEGSHLGLFVMKRAKS